MIALLIALATLTGAALTEVLHYVAHHRTGLTLFVIVVAGATAHWFVRLFVNQGTRVAPRKRKRTGVPA